MFTLSDLFHTFLYYVQMLSTFHSSKYTVYKLYAVPKIDHQLHVIILITNYMLSVMGLTTTVQRASKALLQSCFTIINGLKFYLV